jgi:hypothetical protein
MDDVHRYRILDLVEAVQRARGDDIPAVQDRFCTEPDRILGRCT